MFARSSTPLGVPGSEAVPAVPRAAVRAYLALMAGLGCLATTVMLMMAVATNSGSEAERIAAAQDDTYAATLTSALAANLSKPLR
jgi:hypothetical protein